VTNTRSETEAETTTEAEAETCVVSTLQVVAPRKSTRQRLSYPLPSNGAVLAYTGITKYYSLNIVQIEAIGAQVTDIPKWEGVIRAYCLKYPNKTNIEAMLDWYRDGIPKNGNGKPHARAGPPEYPHMDIQEVGRLNDIAGELPE
jgi:hypothetical protein